MLRIRSENRLPPNVGETEETEELFGRKTEPSPPAGGGASPADPRDRVDCENENALAGRRLGAGPGQWLGF